MSASRARASRTPATPGSSSHRPLSRLSRRRRRGRAATGSRTFSRRSGRFGADAVGRSGLSASFRRAPDVDDYRRGATTPATPGSRPARRSLRWTGIGNTILDKGRCFAGDEPFDPALGLTGGEDTVFLHQLTRARPQAGVVRARPIAWETVPADRLESELSAAAGVSRRAERRPSSAPP